MKRRAFWSIGLAVTILAGLALWRLSDHDLDRRQSERFDFTVAGDVISGTLWLPAEAPKAAIVLVHGDGPQDRTSAGGYAPLINVFLDRGIAVACWDKPGIGQSEGNWLLQSMADRTVETRIALEGLGKRFGPLPRGAIGFSQAGWVLPALTPEDTDFVVLIGPAISWQDQGDYYTRTRLKLDGLSEEAIAVALEEGHVADEHAFGPEARPGDAPDGMSPDRWRFIRENRNADASDALASLDVPLLAIWGAEDLNVDAAGAAGTYRTLLTDRDAETKILLWPDATHGLLKAHAYNWQLSEDWSWFAKLRFVAEGRHAFAPGALQAITDWIADRVNGET